MNRDVHILKLIRLTRLKSRLQDTVYTLSPGATKMGKLGCLVHINPARVGRRSCLSDVKDW